jgi:2-dehydropantoate 2-reductase
MRICSVGAGALGGVMAAKLAQSGVDMTVVERGAHRDAMLASGGLFLEEPDRDRVHVPLRIAEFEDVGPVDVVILGMKATDLEAVAPHVPALCHETTTVVTIQNGIPWWYFQRHGGVHDGRTLMTLDPEGVIGSSIEPDRIIGCIAHSAAERPEPGVVRLVSPGRSTIGELDGSTTPRIEALFESFEDAGLRSRIIGNIRAEIWLKAWGSLSFNPITALTGATLREVCVTPETRALARSLMEEAEIIAMKLDITFRRTIDDRLAGAERVGDHTTSMLQDVRAGRRLEVAALIGAVRELGVLTQVPTPTIDTIHALTGLLDDTIGRRPPPPDPHPRG